MNCCKLEQVGTKEHGKMLSRTVGSLPKEATFGKLKDKKKENHEKWVSEAFD